MSLRFQSPLPSPMGFLADDEFEPSARLAESLQDLSTAGYEIGMPVPISAVRKHAERQGQSLNQADLDTGVMILTHRGLVAEVGNGNIRPIGPLLEALKLGALAIKAPAPSRPMNSRGPRIFAISAGGSEGRLWNAWRSENILTVYGPEWDQIRDLRTFRNFDEYAAEYTPRFGRKGIKEDLWKVRSLQPGDTILAIQGQSRILGCGVVQVPGYFYRESRATECHTAAVVWSNLPARSIPRQSGWLKTIHEVHLGDFEHWFPDFNRPELDLGKEEHSLALAGEFTPLDIDDARKKVLAAIVRRRGQGAFRDALLDRFGGRCVVTGCDVPEALEAAHIVPYLGDHTNKPENGLLLRADIHTLFDLGLLGIDESTWTLRLQIRLQGGAYGSLEGSIIDWGKAGPPPMELFRQRREVLGWSLT